MNDDFLAFDSPERDSDLSLQDLGKVFDKQDSMQADINKLKTYFKDKKLKLKFKRK